MSARTLRVFEHERIVPGAKTREGAVVPHDLDLATLARFNDAHDQRYFRLGWNSVTFCEYVGYLQVGNVAFEILPKADRRNAPGAAGRWKKALLEMLRVATGMQLHASGDAAQNIARSSLLELIACAFLDEVDRLVREGLARAYRSHEANGTAFRGRLLVAENLRENLVRPDRFFVRFSTFDRDVTVNRVLAEALRAIESLPLSGGSRSRAAGHRLTFGDLSRLRITGALLERIEQMTLGRSTARYQRALSLARMILESVASTLTRGRKEVVAFLFDMNRLWESYVAALFRGACVPGLRVKTQASRIFWRAEGCRPKTVRPDIVIADAATDRVLLVVDTKWKLTEKGVPSGADVQQSFIYNELFGCAQTLLLYPAPDAGTATVTGSFAVAKGHVCRTACLGLFEGEQVRTHVLLDEVGAFLRSSWAQPPAAE